MVPDTITVEVLRNKLEGIADEMELTLLKSSYSSMVSEALDASAALFTADGETIAQAVGIPLHLGTMIPAVRRMIEVFPVKTMEPADAFILNDPFEGGTHLPDLIVVMPVFFEGSVVALSCALTHHQELGGARPGSSPMDAEEIFQEGLRIPPLKLMSRGEPNETFFRLIERNVRVPDEVRGDIMGQVAACTVGARRLEAVIKDFGKETVLAAVEELLSRSEQLMRSAISRIPDGRYEFLDYLDNDGIDLDRRIPIKVAVEVQGSEIYADLEGSARQVRGPINCVASSTLSAIYFVIRAVCAPDLPRNSGCYRPIKVKLPGGSIVNANFPAAVNARAVTVRRVDDAMYGALGQAVPRQVPAASNGHPLVISFGGVDPETGALLRTSEIGTGGMGARYGKDGIDCITTDTSNTMNIPVESMEFLYPLRVHRYSLRKDSGGAGKWRGGVGFEKVIEVLRGTVLVSHRGERNFTAPWGVWGGGSGAKAESTVAFKDGRQLTIPSKLDFEMSAGDRIYALTTGGGGYGDPFERDPELVLADVLDGKVSEDQARSAYGVVVDTNRKVVNAQDTLALRTRLREKRGPITWTHDFGDPRGREKLVPLAPSTSSRTEV